MLGNMMFDEEAPQKKDATASLTKADLERLSLHELQDLMAQRQLDIALIELEIQKKSSHAAAAAALFKA